MFLISVTVSFKKAKPNQSKKPPRHNPKLSFVLSFSNRNTPSFPQILPPIKALLQSKHQEEESKDLQSTFKNGKEFFKREESLPPLNRTVLLPLSQNRTSETSFHLQSNFRSEHSTQSSNIPLNRAQKR
ncbi:hypothetical protein PIB30_073749 [Stylosanthes scabra]|uniref:Uncharacterized protein n=1 Tax=Stylosanthes scabra TaxID=79078 RepID=A0ABU6XMZ4_9FABA|nr:hypothetical protein [Stylosanthes scabra]